MLNHHHFKRKYLSCLPVISLGRKTLEKGSTFEGKNLLREDFVPIVKGGINKNDIIASPESVPFIIICSKITIYFLSGQVFPLWLPIPCWGQ